MNFENERVQILQKFNQITARNRDIFDDYILDLFRFQYKYNKIYRQYCTYLNVRMEEVLSVDKIPFLPISAFKHHDVITGDFEADQVFWSSGTTGQTRSKHLVRDLDFYLQNTVEIWKTYFKPVEEYCFLALLPGYLERDGSSLISMVDHFISKSKYSESGFYLRNHDELFNKLQYCKENHIPTVLIGVKYALLYFVEAYSIDYPELIIIETGGMKGNRKEISKKEVHDILKQAFKVQQVLSEYGMTELLSQAYSLGSEKFTSNAKLKIIIRQTNDPLTDEKLGKPGILSLIDLANVDSCAFIQTEDLGIKYDEYTFEIIGRLNHADTRGCNLMIQDL